MLRSLNTTHHSSSVRSGCSIISASSTVAWSSSGEVLPPRRLAAKSPSDRQRCTQRIAELSLTPNRSPAACRVAPASTAQTTRSRRSCEYGFAIPAPKPVERALSQVRAWVEHPFHIVKNLFRHKKLRYRDLAKNTAKLHTLFALD